MNERENDKKQREVEECKPVAAQLNLQPGTDYVARPSRLEPADVLFESPSGAHADPGTGSEHPHDYQIRADIVTTILGA
jgi:hypothetical protein